MMLAAAFQWISYLTCCCSGVAQDLDTKEAVEAVREFEASSLGVAISFGVEFFESESKQTVVGDYSNLRFYLARDANGSYCNYYSEDKINESKGEQILTADQKRFLAVGPNVSVRLQDSTGIIRENVYVTPLVGVSLSDRALFTEILEHTSTRLAIQPLQIDGQDHCVLVATNKIYGEYKFWICLQPETRLVRIEISKNNEHEIRTHTGLKKKLGDPFPAEPVRLKQLPNDKKATYLAGLKNVPTRESEVYKFEKFSALSNGKSFPKLITRGVSTTIGDKTEFVGLSYSITDIEPFEIDDPSRAEFRRVVVPNGKRVTVEGQEGLAWKYDNGTIVRVVDNDTIGSLNGVRFRKPGTQTWYLILFAVTLILVAWVIYKRWKLA
jgi:hypothetical protein